jgi:hypothetical protein
MSFTINGSTIDQTNPKDSSGEKKDKEPDVQTMIILLDLARRRESGLTTERRLKAFEIIAPKRKYTQYAC